VVTEVVVVLVVWVVVVAVPVVVVVRVVVVPVAVVVVVPEVVEVVSVVEVLVMVIVEVEVVVVLVEEVVEGGRQVRQLYGQALRNDVPSSPSNKQPPAKAVLEHSGIVSLQSL
jgi:hypothetical protein